MCERVREKLPNRPNYRPEHPTRLTRNQPGHISHFLPPFRPRKVPNGRLESARGFSAIIAAENQPERRRSKLENPRLRPFSSPLIPPVFGDVTG
ncbi:hypothetical protein CUMW_122750 [Citrus unshiu]|uniref:Uncharacterized protein n=1 Tax=Citrus unshiu TaxID=55188 RepID=A0A2H5PC38_CITUN|nr:hypothetical protein CUMW_122750 [Citrus unshiu]